MIRVTIGTNVRRETITVDENSTIKEVLTSNGVDLTTGNVTLDGIALRAVEINSTFSEMGVDGSVGHDSCYLLKIAKEDNA